MRGGAKSSNHGASLGMYAEADLGGEFGVDERREWEQEFKGLVIK